MNKLGLLATGTLAALLTGCDVHEKSTYASTPSIPQTVALRDTSTGEQLWSYDVPPGQQLKVWFKNSRSRANEQGYDEMVWTVAPIGQGPSPQENRMRVPPPMNRRLEGSVRPAEMATKTPPAAPITP